MTDTQKTTPKPRRRWFLFSLRTLLVAVFLLGVLFALGTWMQRVRRIRHVEETIHKLGGAVRFRGHGGAVVALNRPWVTDKELKDLVELSQPKWIFIASLDLRESAVTNKGLEHLSGLTNLQLLYLNGRKVTNAGLEHLKGLTKLEWLDLGNTQVTDEGLEHLKGLTKLEELWLNDNQTTDAGLEHLKGLTKLEHLDLVAPKSPAPA